MNSPSQNRTNTTRKTKRTRLCCFCVKVSETVMRSSDLGEERGTGARGHPCDKDSVTLRKSVQKQTCQHDPKPRGNNFPEEYKFPER